MEVLCIIPARGGSKGIRRKNIRNFCGKPLIKHTIDQAKKSRVITRVIVSTEDPEIARVAEAGGAEVPFLRPKSLAEDASQVVDALLYTLKKLSDEEHYHPDILVMLQTTSPLRTVKDIDDSLLAFLNSTADTMMTVCETEQLLYTLDAQNRLVLESPKKFLASTNRQALPQTYLLNGAMVYATRCASFLKKKSFLKGDVMGYVLPVWRSVDLDEPADFVVAELLFQHMKQMQKKIKNFV